MTLPDGLLGLLRRPSPCFLASLMPDGSPQMTQTWVDTDGTNVLINTVEGHQKVRNMRRDPRVALNVADPDDPSSYVEVRGRVVGITPDGVVEHLEALAQRYLGGPYPWYGGRDQVRLLVTIEPDRVTSPRG
jgi:PPOX class probable F420-dependent enzyme